MFAKDFRKVARDSLRNKWWLAIFTGFVATLLGGANTGGSVNFNHSQSIDPELVDAELVGDPNIFDIFKFSYDVLMSPEIMAMWLPLFTMIAIYSLVLFFISGAVNVGYSRFNLYLVDGVQVAFGDLFSEFPQFWRAFVMNFLRGLYVFLWALLFVIPGIIASYAYAMTPYLLAERPDLTASQSIAASKEMMKGHKGELFYLHLTFIGWILLSVFLTWGIGLFLVVPYMNAAEAAFYRHVSGKSQQVVSNDGAPSEPQSRPPMFEEPVPVERTKDRSSSLDMDNL